MRRLWILIPLLAACGGPPPEPAAPAAAVATWQGGALTLADLESAYAEARTPACVTARRRGGGLEDLLPCYRELAEALAVERLVLAEVADVEAAGAGLERYDQLRRHAYLDTYLRRLPEEIEIADAEIEAHFAAHRERYRRPAQLTLWNLFRRHQDPAKPEETLAFLRGLKERYEAGETFGALAREHSHSETRLADGLVGPITEGRLPAKLEEIAFSLADGEVSEPVRVRGGAVLLHVRNVVEGVDFSLDEAREAIRRELAGQRLEDLIAERVAGLEPPPGSVVLAPEEVVAALDEEAQAVVLDLGGDRLTAGQLRALAGLAAGAKAAELDDEARERLAELYRRQRNRRLLALELPRSADAEHRREAEEHLREAALAAVVDERLREEMERLLDTDPDKLRSYFDDNRHHYQSPLRFELRRWDLPFGADPPRQLRRMEELRERLAAGELELAAAVAELGGTVEDLGWRELDSLAGEMPPKARRYLLEVGASGWSVPYQDRDALHLLRLVGREEPRPLDYEEAREQVRGDYLARFRQQLYRRVLEARLAAAGFAFDEDAVRRRLAEPAAKGP